jgi:Calponin homology (CH) domain
LFFGAFVCACVACIQSFFAWTNYHLSKRQIKVDSFEEAFSDGVSLLHLLEIISCYELPKFDHHPKVLLQKLDNLNIALKFISDSRIRVLGCGAEDLLDGNKKLMLSLIWQLVLASSLGIWESQPGKLTCCCSLLCVSSCMCPALVCRPSPEFTRCFCVCFRDVSAFCFRVSLPAASCSIERARKKAMIEWIKQNSGSHPIEVFKWGECFKDGKIFLALLNTMAKVDVSVAMSIPTVCSGIVSSVRSCVCGSLCECAFLFGKVNVSE